MASSSMPVLRFEVGSTVTPGDRIGSIREVVPGKGCYSRGAHVYSSVVGKLAVSPRPRQDASPSFVVNIQGPPFASSRVLRVGQIVLGRVERLTWQQAFVKIVAAEGLGALKDTHEGAIRKEDVKAGATEEVQLQDSFRPNDIVVCRIVSLGDSRKYYLSTAETELGVVRATCQESGKIMVPISWKEMKCPETKAKEPRKCAKPKNLKEMFMLRNNAL